MLIGNGRTRVDLLLTDDLGLLLVDPRFDGAIDGLHEVLAVIAKMKSQEVVAEQAVEQLFLPRKDAERLAVGPGNVPELGDDQVRIPLLEIARQESEVIILDEHKGRPAVGFLEDRVAESALTLRYISQCSSWNTGRVNVTWQSGQSPALERPW